ncbi:MAG: hypothetical protein IT331_17830, partial [Anaerolineae bacterium]|nr:hypothetical protein [Anaerolineae bacterium]
FFGMALVIVWDYIALWLGVNLAMATWALGGGALGVMVVARMKGEISRSARNDKPNVRNDKLDARNDKLDARNDKLDARNDKLDARNDKLDARNDKLDARNDKLDARNDKPNVRNDKLDARNDKLDARNDTSTAQEDMPGTVGLAKVNLWVVALAVLAFCAAVAPLWRYGFVTVIGENWDYEFYLPLADYLREMTTAQLANAPPNPLLSTILSRHILPLPMGFSYLHATLNELLRTRALDTFPILMGVLRALGVVGAFLFFRAGFKMSERAALVATALVAVNGLLLWFTYWGFGLHIAALALLPVGLLPGVIGLEAKRDWRAWLSAGLLLGALNVTYHPALIAAGLSLGAYGVWLLLTERERGQVALNGAVIAALTLAFSFPTLGHLDDFVREYYGRTPLAVGLREFVPFADGYGFSNQTLELVVGQTISTPQLFAIAQAIWNGSGTILTLAAAGFSILALWELRQDKERRGVWYAMTAAAMIYVLASRLPFLRPYPYGFLKSLSLVSYVLIALTVQGIVFAWARKGTSDKSRRVVRYGAIAALAVVGALCLFTFGITLEQYFKPAPMFFDADALRVRELDALLAGTAAGQTSPSVFLTDRAEVQGIPMGLVGYALRNEPLYGDVSTGYGELNNAAPNAVYDYALLTRGEDPVTRGYAMDAVWENRKFALYPREPGTLAHQYINEFRDPALPFELTVDVNGLPGKEGAIDHTPAERALTLGLVTFRPTRLTLQVGEEAQTLELGRGLGVYTFPQAHLPTTLAITPHDADELYVPFLQLREVGATAGGLETSNATIVRCLGNEMNLGVLCRVVNPQGREFTWKWIVRGTAEKSREDKELVVVQAEGSPRARVRVRVDERGAFQEIQFDEDAPIALAREKLPPGKWRADLEVWDGDRLMARFPVHPVYQIGADGSSMWRENRMLPPVIFAR